jgi:hypothetical protein
MWDTSNNNEDENLIVDTQTQDYEVHVFLPGTEPNQQDVENLMRAQTEQTSRTTNQLTTFVFFLMYLIYKNYFL